MRASAFANDLGPGWFSDVALMNGQGWLIAGFGAAGAVTVRVLTWTGTDVSSLREIYSAPIIEGFGYGRIAAVPGGDVWCAFHDGRTAHLHNLTTGAHAVLDPSSGSSPVCFGAGYFAWQGAQAQGWPVSRLKLGTASIDDHVRNGQPTGLSRVDEAGNVVLVDEDRLRLSGATQPAFAGNLGVGEGADGGVLWRVTLVSVNGQAQRTGFVWPGEPTFTPRCAAEDDTVAVCTAGGPGVRLFCGSRDELYSLTGTVVVPPPVAIVPDPPAPPVDPPKPPIGGTQMESKVLSWVGATVINSPMVEHFPVRAAITKIEITDSGVRIWCDGMQRWPNVKPTGAPDVADGSPIVSTLYVGLEINGVPTMVAAAMDYHNQPGEWLETKNPSTWGPPTPAPTIFYNELAFMGSVSKGQKIIFGVVAGARYRNVGNTEWPGSVDERTDLYMVPNFNDVWTFPGYTGAVVDPPATGAGDNPPAGGSDTGNTGGGDVPQASSEQLERLIKATEANGLTLVSIDTRLDAIRQNIGETSAEVKKNLPALIAAMAGGGAGGLLTGLLGGKK